MGGVGQAIVFTCVVVRVGEPSRYGAQRKPLGGGGS